MADKIVIDEVAGDGGNTLLTEPTLDELQSEVDQIVQESKDSVWQTRVDTDDLRLCRWDGQSSDGLKHEAAIGEVPEPFEGASDMRVRAADMVVNEQTMLLVLAAMKAQLSFAPTEGSDVKTAGNMTLAMRWLIRTHWGASWVRELIRLANYYLGDSPGVALMRVWWRRETALGMQNVTVDELLKLYMGQVMERIQGSGAANIEHPTSNVESSMGNGDIQAQAQQAAEDFKIALNDPEFGQEVLAQNLMQFFPGIQPARARKVIQQLRETGKGEFPVPYLKYDGPAVAAQRIYEDWWVPLNTTDFQEARIWFTAEWLSKPQIIERKISEGWSDEFVEGVIGKPGRDGKREGGHEAVPAFPEYVRSKDGAMVTRDGTFYNGLYQVLTAYYKATNADGVPGRYYVTFHKEVKVAAHERRLVDYAHGHYPGHVFQREVLTSRLLDSRGLTELAGTYQGLMKMYSDSFGDHSQIAGVPPIITYGRQRMGTLHIRPLVELQAKRDGDYRWMQPPTYPRTVVDMVKELRRQMDEYFGRTNPDVAPDLVQLHKEFHVFWWLTNVREVLTQAWQLFQQYASDELVQRITNRNGEPMFRSREDIQGQFDMSLQFDPRDMQEDYLKNVATIVKDLLMAMDRDKTIQAAPIVSALLWRVSPDLAEAALVDVEQANQTEIADEIKVYGQIRAGTEPELPDDGSINYQLRLQLYQNFEQMNPQIYRDMAPDKLMILQSRLKRLAVLAEQYGENPQIGRQGGRAALPAPEGQTSNIEHRTSNV